MVSLGRGWTYRPPARHAQGIASATPELAAEQIGRGLLAAHAARRFDRSPRALLRMALEDRLVEASGEARRRGGDLLGGTRGDDGAAAVAALRPEIDDPVRGLDHVEVVFDDDDGIAVVAQSVQHREQHFDVVEVQPRGRLVEYVQRTTGVALGQFQGELDALRLAARERGRRLAERDVAQAHVEKRRELARDGGNRFEERMGLLDGEREDVVDVLALVLDLERLPVVPLAVTDIARDV